MNKASFFSNPCAVGGASCIMLRQGEGERGDAG